jgi:hypothetical protein
MTNVSFPLPVSGTIYIHAYYMCVDRIGVQLPNNISCPEASVMTQFPVLPTEIWLKVITEQFNTDEGLEILWLSVRMVSRQFRDIVEDYVQRGYLPSTTIIFSPCSLGVFGLGYPFRVNRQTSDGYWDFTAIFKFTGLSSGNTEMAIFADTEPNAALCGVMLCKIYGVILDHDKKYLGSRGDSFSPRDHPVHLSHIRSIWHIGSSTGKSHLKIDWINLKLECNWKALVSHILYNEKLRNRWHEQLVSIPSYSDRSSIANQCDQPGTRFGRAKIQVPFFFESRAITEGA